MKIAQVVAYWGPAYPTGSGVSCYEISKRLAKEHEVHVFTSDVGDFSRQTDVNGMHLHTQHTYATVFDMNPLADVFTGLMRSEFDIIHVYSYIFFLSNMAALARLFKTRSRYVLHFRGGLNFSNGTADFPSRRVWLKEHIYDSTLGYFTTKMADRVLSVSQSDIPLIRKKFGVRQVDWIPPGVDTGKFVPAAGSPHPPVVSYIGKLEAWKGIGSLVKIFQEIHREMKDVRFLVVGRGSLEKELRELPLPIEFTGHVTNDDMPAIYQRTSVMILPSYMEGLPVCCIESLSCGVPVVATDVGDTAMVIMGGKNGRLAKPGDSRDMAMKTIELLKNDSLRAAMGKSGREYVRENFDFDVITARVVEIYKELLNRDRQVKK